MRTGIADLEDMFARVKNGEIPSEDLFFKIWPNAQTLPRHDLIVFSDQLLTWAKARAKEDKLCYALALETRALIDFVSERHESAFKNNFAAQQIFEEINDEKGIGITKVTNGAVFRSLGDIDLALQSFTEAWEVLKSDKKYNFLKVIAVYNLAEIYAASKHYADSIKYYKDALENGTEYEYLTPLFLSGLGTVYHLQKQDALAEEYLTRALTLCRETNAIPFTVSRILSELGTYYFDLGNFDEAIARHQESLHLREAADILGGAVTNMLQIAKIYSLQHKDHEAINILTRALEMAESIHVKPKIAQVHQLLSTIFEKTGDNAKSLEHYKEFFRINEEVNFEDAEKKVKNTLIIFEAAHARKENVIIRAQKKEIEHKNTELQNTINELTLTKISRKAKAISFTIAIALFIVEDSLIHFFVAPYVHENYLVSLIANGIIIFCIKPIEKVTEHYLLQKFVMQKRKIERIDDEQDTNAEASLSMK